MTDSDTPILTAGKSDKRHGLGAKSATSGDLDEDLVRLVSPDLSGDSTSSGVFIGQKSEVHAQPRDTDPVLGFDGDMHTHSANTKHCARTSTIIVHAYSANTKHCARTNTITVHTHSTNTKHCACTSTITVHAHNVIKY